MSKAETEKVDKWLAWKIECARFEKEKRAHRSLEDSTLFLRDHINKLIEVGPQIAKGILTTKAVIHVRKLQADYKLARNYLEMGANHEAPAAPALSHQDL